VAQTYKLSDEAKDHLREIARWGTRHHGIKKSREYRDRLKAHFAALADNPLLYAPVDHIRPGYRRSVCGVHSIYYRIRDDVVEIMAILRAQDVGSWLPDDEIGG